MIVDSSKKTPRQKTSLYIPVKIIGMIEDIARKHDIPKNRVLDFMIQQGMEVYYDEMKKNPYLYD